MKEDTNNTRNKLAGYFIASQIFFLTLCYFLKDADLIVEKLKNVLKGYIWWCFGSVWLPVDTTRALIEDCQDWCHNEADSWGKLSCGYSAISTLFSLVCIGWSGYFYGLTIWHSFFFLIFDDDHRDTISADNNSALEAGVLCDTDCKL